MQNNPDVEEIVNNIRSLAYDSLTSEAEHDTGAEAPWHGEPPPGARVKSAAGWGDAIHEAFQRGRDTLVEEATAPIRDIPGGIRQGVEALQTTEPTVLGKLRQAGEVGLGGLHAGLSVGRAAFSPVSALARTATELPVLLAEKQGEERKPNAETARRVSQVALELATGVGAARGVEGVLARLRAARAGGIAGPSGEAGAAVAPVIAPEAAAATPAAEAVATEVRAPRGLPGIGETYDPAQDPRLFRAGPPRSVTSRPSEVYEPGLVDPETGRIAKGAGLAEPVLPGERPKTDVTTIGADRRPGESVIDALKRKAQEAEPAIAAEAGVQQPGETLGQQIRRNLRAQKARTIDEVPGEPDVTTKNMSLGDRVKLTNPDEQAKVVDAAANLTPEQVAGTPRHIRDAIYNNQPEDVVNRPGWLTGGAKNLLTRIKMNLPLSMTQVAKGDSVLSEIVSRMKNATVAEQALKDELITAFNQLEKKVGGPKAMEQLISDIDRKVVPSNQGQNATEFRALFDKAARANSLDPAHPLYEQGYVPHIRNTVKIEKTRLIPVEDWVSTDVMRSFPSHFRPSYTKARKIDLPGTDYTSDTMRAHLGAAARGAVWGTPIHHGVLKDLEPLLRRLDDRPAWYQDFVANYINYAIGHPNFRSTEGMQKLGNVVKTTEFMRTIVGNVTSPIYNSFQRILPMAEVSVKSTGKALMDEARWLKGDPEAVRIVKAAEIPLESLGLNKLDTEAFLGGRAQQLVTKLKDWGAKPFGFAERQNRVFTLFAGYRNALEKGATEAEAIQAGKDLIQKTQFTPGPTDRPVWMRGEVGSMVGQFKYFQTKMGEYITNNFTDMFARGASPAERLAAANKFVKFWGISYALGGPQVMPFVGDWLDKHDPVAWKGALPYLGMAVRDQLGTGGLVPKDLESLKFYLPGPAVSHLRDIGVAVVGTDIFDPTKDQSVSARVRGAVRSIPLAGVQLERLRRGGIVGPDFTERQPQTIAEAIPPAIGGTPIPAERPLLARDVPKYGRMIGIQDLEMQKSFDAMDELNRAGAILNRAKADAAQAMAIGDQIGASKILRDVEKELGLPIGRVKLSPQGAKGAASAAKMTPLERRRKALGKDLRDYGLEDTLP
jgi:hypothetical protein